MKKIIFGSPHLIVAGVERALINMLKFTQDKFETTAIFIRARGGERNNLPKNIKILEVDVNDQEAERLLGGGAVAAVKYFFKKGSFIRAAKTGIGKMIGKPFPEFQGNFKKIENVDGEFDVSICYHLHMPFMLKFMAEKVNAKKRIAFVHNDMKKSGYGKKLLKLKKLLYKYDEFYCVSQQLYDEFIEFFPELVSKTKILHNILNVTSIREQAGVTPNIFEDNYEGIRLLTIGRLNEQKGIDLAIETMHQIKSQSLVARWYVIGEGEQRSELQKQINLNNLQNDFILLGIKKNPYAFINQCDIYVQPSRHEGYCTTVNEARVLGKPIIVTDVAGSREMLVNNETGLIVEFDSQQLMEAIIKLINDCSLREKFNENLKKIDWAESVELMEFVKNL